MILSKRMGGIKGGTKEGIGTTFIIQLHFTNNRG
jgi:hypothetical protein